MSVKLSVTLWFSLRYLIFMSLGYDLCSYAFCFRALLRFHLSHIFVVLTLHAAHMSTLYWLGVT
jgi:hypothetical protein